MNYANTQVQNNSNAVYNISQSDKGKGVTLEANHPTGKPHFGNKSGFSNKPQEYTDLQNSIKEKNKKDNYNLHGTLDTLPTSGKNVSQPNPNNNYQNLLSNKMDLVVNHSLINMSSQTPLFPLVISTPVT